MVKVCWNAVHFQNCLIGFSELRYAFWFLCCRQRVSCNFQVQASGRKMRNTKSKYCQLETCPLWPKSLLSASIIHRVGWICVIFDQTFSLLNILLFIIHKKLLNRGKQNIVICWRLGQIIDLWDTDKSLHFVILASQLTFRHITLHGLHHLHVEPRAHLCFPEIQASRITPPQDPGTREFHHGGAWWAFMFLLVLFNTTVLIAHLRRYWWSMSVQTQFTFRIV